MLNKNINIKILIFIFFLILFFVGLHLFTFFNSFSVEFYGFNQKNFIVVDKSNFLLKGKAKGIKKLYINNKEIDLDINFNFSRNLYLSEYQNIFYIKSIDKINKITSKKLIIYFNKLKTGENF